MRQFSEPTVRNLLREPLVFGVPMPAMTTLLLSVVVLEIPLSSFKNGNFVLIGYTVLGYIGLRALNFFSKPGYLEGWIYFLEQKFSKKVFARKEMELPQEVLVLAPDTLDQEDLILLKEPFLEKFKRLNKDEEILFTQFDSERGAITEVYSNPSQNNSLNPVRRNELYQSKHIYSLYHLPNKLDPLWLFSVLSQIKGSTWLYFVVRGIDSEKIKSKLQNSRTRNANVSKISNIDSEVTFEETSDVLESISRGNDSIVEASLVLFCDEKQSLDSRYFILENEKNRDLVICSILRERKRLHRKLLLRAVTATDLVPNINDPADPNEMGILKSVRGKTLYFDPQDKRLEALHWLVVGASGSGKSFFVGTILLKLFEQSLLTSKSNDDGFSILFIDHNRSFGRLLSKFSKKAYLEPKSSLEVHASFQDFLKTNLSQHHRICGIELSDLPISEKKEAIAHILQTFEQFLKDRPSSFPIYLVLDECWQYLRDEPLLVQRVFREFRKLNGAAIAITQSLSDFLTDESGRSIFQNAPIRILLRQGEDLSPYKGVLNLNETELKKLRLLRQEKENFSECLIKTPYSSQLARLYPTQNEYKIFRTDNLRAEFINSKKHPSPEARTL